MELIRANFDITIYRGDTHVEQFQMFSDKEQKIPIDLTNSKLTGMARIDPNDVKWFDLPIEITDAVNGKWKMAFSSADTALMGSVGKTHSGRFDIQNETKGEVFTFAIGSVTVTDDYTYKG